LFREIVYRVQQTANPQKRAGGKIKGHKSRSHGVGMRKCRYCKVELPKAKNSKPIERHGFCSYEHMAQYGHEKAVELQEKAKRKEVRQAKERIKTKAQHARELQTLVNKYIRLRDQGRPCISCEKPDDGSHQRHASHYRSVGACSSLRFNTLNIHASCAQCNSHKSGNILEYRIRLIRMFGEAFVDRLECAPKSQAYSLEWIGRAKKIFRKRCKTINRAGL